jgi:hypothetical protein
MPIIIATYQFAGAVTPVSADQAAPAMRTSAAPAMWLPTVAESLVRFTGPDGVDDLVMPFGVHVLREGSRHLRIRACLNALQYSPGRN